MRSSVPKGLARITNLTASCRLSMLQTCRIYPATSLPGSIWGIYPTFVAGEPRRWHRNCLWMSVCRTLDAGQRTTLAPPARTCQPASERGVRHHENGGFPRLPFPPPPCSGPWLSVRRRSPSPGIAFFRSSSLNNDPNRPWKLNAVDRRRAPRRSIFSLYYPRCTLYWRTT